MALDPELAKLLNRGQQAYSDGLDEANPPPPNGVYIMLLMDLKASGYEAKKPDGSKVPTTRIGLKLRVVGDQAYDGYTFQLGFLSTASTMMGQFSTFATAALGRPEPNLAKAYEALLAEKGSGLFEVEVTRETGKNNVTYVKINARRKIVEDAPPAEAA